MRQNRLAYDYGYKIENPVMRKWQRYRNRQRHRNSGPFHCLAVFVVELVLQGRSQELFWDDAIPKAIVKWAILTMPRHKIPNFHSCFYNYMETWKMFGYFLTHSEHVSRGWVAKQLFEIKNKTSILLVGVLRWIICICWYIHSCPFSFSLIKKFSL